MYSLFYHKQNIIPLNRIKMSKGLKRPHSFFMDSFILKADLPCPFNKYSEILFSYLFFKNTLLFIVSLLYLFV
jgi:hypothetical protein